jgi:serine/threonine protein kinase
VLPLIDPTFVNLAGPPSLASCTRDVYPTTARFDLASVRCMALGIASAAAHLHAQGLMHGDLYAHNILYNGLGHVLLGDFGAASFLPASDAAQAQALQQLEVRAFGCLLEELIDRCQITAHETKGLDTLIHIKAQCLHTDSQTRPLFAEISRRLSLDCSA